MKQDFRLRSRAWFRHRASYWATAIGLLAISLSSPAADFGGQFQGTLGPYLSHIGAHAYGTGSTVGSPSASADTSGLFAEGFYSWDKYPLVFDAVAQFGLGNGLGLSRQGYAENGDGLQLYAGYRFGRSPAAFYAGGGALYNDQHVNGGKTEGALLSVGYFSPVPFGRDGRLNTSLRFGPVRTTFDGGTTHDKLLIAEGLYGFRLGLHGAVLSQLGISTGLRLEGAAGHGSASGGITYDDYAYRVTLLVGVSFFPERYRASAEAPQRVSPRPAHEARVKRGGHVQKKSRH